MSMGKRLTAERKLSKLTLEKISEYLGISYQAYRKYEKDVCYPSVEILVKIAKMYNTSTDYIVGLTDDKRKYW